MAIDTIPTLLVLASTALWSTLIYQRDGFERYEYGVAGLFFVFWLAALVAGSWMAIALLPGFPGIAHMGGEPA